MAPHARRSRALSSLTRAALAAVLAVALSSTGARAQSAGVVALRFAAVVNPGQPTITDAVVVVRGDKIVSVGSGAATIPAGAWIVDLRPLTAIPGMIDAHTHMTYWRDKVKSPQGPSPRSPDTLLVLLADNARKTLETGVTTVRDLNAGGGIDILMRDAINKGAMIGPRMFVSGQGMSKRATDTVPLDIKAMVRARVDAGADWIKMFGSIGSGQNVTSTQTFTDAEMKLAAETAHAYGKRITIHSYGPSGARGALHAGVESIEHPAGVPQALLEEWAKTNVFYVPTIDHNRFYRDNATLLGYPQAVPQLDSFIALNLETATRAHKLGIKFAMGSDALYWMFGDNTRELGWYIKAGMTPEEALATATTNGAAMLGMADKLGAIGPGYFADIAAVEGDPLRDIDVVINNVRWVMKGGTVVVDKRTGVTTTSAR
ncbi:MAG: amidohydrolase family protein [Gemmatimonadetes bacterium]|nr:amidohydrolase family protein [Gemmatimonadota bacterium]